MESRARAAVALVAVDAVLDELVPDRRRASPELFGNLRHGSAASGEELNPLAFVYGHLFHGLCFLSFLRVAVAIGGTRLRDGDGNGIE